MMETSSSENTNPFRHPIELAAVRSHRLAEVRHRLPSFAGQDASDAALLALWKFAIRKPQMYFDRKTATAVRDTLQDLVDSGCRMLTLGQYLQPTKEHLAVDRYVHPTEFDQWKASALEMGFSEVASGPFVRSSYHAKELYEAL